MREPLEQVLITPTLELSDAVLRETVRAVQRNFDRLAGRDDYWHVVGGTGEPAFNTAWANFGGGFQSARFRKQDGVVYLEGLVASGTIGTRVFTLPTGYRPAADLLFTASANGALARMDIQSDGDVMAQAGSNVWFSLMASFLVD